MPSEARLPTFGRHTTSLTISARFAIVTAGRRDGDKPERAQVEVAASALDEPQQSVEDELERRKVCASLARRLQHEIDILRRHRRLKGRRVVAVRHPRTADLDRASGIELFEELERSIGIDTACTAEREEFGKRLRDIDEHRIRHELEGCR